MSQSPRKGEEAQQQVRKYCTRGSQRERVGGTSVLGVNLSNYLRAKCRGCAGYNIHSWMLYCACCNGTYIIYTYVVMIIYMYVCVCNIYIYIYYYNYIYTFDVIVIYLYTIETTKRLCFKRK